MAVVTAALLIVATRSRVPVALDPHVAATIDDHLVDRRIAEPSLEASQRRTLGDHVDHAALRNETMSDLGNLASNSPASTARATAGSRRTSATTGTPSACSTSRDVSARPGSSTSTMPVGRMLELLRPADRDEARTNDQERLLGRLAQCRRLGSRCRRR